MFINVVYKDAPELSMAARRASNEPDPAMEKTLLVNPNCPVRIMLEYIRKHCKLGIFTVFDLCDESGCLMGLFSMETYAYATDRFEHKRTYYIIVMKSGSDKRPCVLPQLNQDNLLYPELMRRVEQFLLTNNTPLDAVSPSTVKTTSSSSKVATSMKLGGKKQSKASKLKNK